MSILSGKSNFVALGNDFVVAWGMGGSLTRSQLGFQDVCPSTGCSFGGACRIRVELVMDVVVLVGRRAGETRNELGTREAVGIICEREADICPISIESTERLAQ